MKGSRRVDDRIAARRPEVEIENVVKLAMWTCTRASAGCCVARFRASRGRRGKGQGERLI
jgi:hypothetical protein